VVEQIASADSRVSIIDTGAAVNGPDGAFSMYLPCLSGELCTDTPTPGFNQVRTSDGLHLCPGVHSDYYLKCSKYASGALRYGSALAAPVIADLSS
jgi:hypothetical protein